jgi:hypothetical protein
MMRRGVIQEAFDLRSPDLKDVGFNGQKISFLKEKLKVKKREVKN